MPLTKDQAAEKTIARLIENGEKADGLLKPDIISWIDEALQRLARRIADSEDYRELQKEITGNIVGGSYAIVDTTILVDTIPSVGLVLAKPSRFLSASYISGQSVVQGSVGDFSSADVGGEIVYSDGNRRTIISIGGSSGTDAATISGTNPLTGTLLHVVDPNYMIAKVVPRYDSLFSSLQFVDINHYSLRGKSLYFKLARTGLTNAPSTVLVLANFVPTLGVGGNSDLPVRFETQLIDTLIEMAYEKQNRKPPALIQTGGSN